jgi:hypothetical protein
VKRAFLIASLLALLLAGPASAGRISQSERRAINRTIDAFVNTAVKRQNVDAAWNLVTPEVRAGVSRSAWDAGNLPVYPYRAGGTTFHEWTVDSATANEVDFELMVPSAKSKSDSIQFNGTMRRLHGRWLVDSFNPSATFAAGGTVVGPHDFAASQGGGGGKGVARLGSAWIALPAVLIGAAILFLLGWLLFALMRNRRARREYRRPLDPLVVKRRESKPALVAKERGQTDG